MKNHTFIFDYGKIPDKKLGEYQVAFLNNDNPVAVDVGCSVGAFPVMYSHLFSKVFAVDACYTNLKTLDRNLISHGISNCFPFHFAAGRTTGELVEIVNPGASPYNNVSLVENCFFKSKNRNQGSTQCINESTLSKDSQYHYAISVSFSDLLKFLGLSRVDFLKVDIEGAEYAFLYEADLSVVDILAIEIHFSSTKKSKSLISKIEENFSYLSKKEGTHSEYLMINKTIEHENLKYGNPRPNCDMIFKYEEHNFGKH